MSHLIKEFVKCIIESMKMREADISDDKRVPWGSADHIKDLESRIESLKKWRDKHKRGSDSKANYTRLISQLRAELRSANKHSNKES